MKLFLDSAVLSEVEEAFSWGVVEGVTTNPSLLKKAVEKNQGDLELYIRSILKAAKPFPVSLEVTKSNVEEVVAEAKALFKMFNHTARNVCIKIPICLSDDEDSLLSGLKSISEVSKLKIPVNATLIFTPEQALLAAKAGAKFVSPFVGRLDDFIRDSASVKYSKDDYFPAEGLSSKGVVLNDEGIVSGVDLVRRCSLIIKKHGLSTEVIAASIRNPRQVRECAEAGAHIATLPFSVIKKLVVHKKTFEGVKKFSEDTVKEYEGLTKK
ncbi:transaldolase [Candidatus Woesearchaeota archaeon]|nr:transaldolase [Candidatus Woesearchaeota archaeon]